jgi:hypothetical protein
MQRFSYYTIFRPSDLCMTVCEQLVVLYLRYLMKMRLLVSPRTVLEALRYFFHTGLFWEMKRAEDVWPALQLPRHKTFVANASTCFVLYSRTCVLINLGPYFPCAEKSMNCRRYCTTPRKWNYFGNCIDMQQPRETSTHRFAIVVIQISTVKVVWKHDFLLFRFRLCFRNRKQLAEGHLHRV